MILTHKSPSSIIFLFNKEFLLFQSKKMNTFSVYHKLHLASSEI
jgi:hypothetical protein